MDELLLFVHVDLKDEGKRKKKKKGEMMHVSYSCLTNWLGVALTVLRATPRAHSGQHFARIRPQGTGVRTAKQQP